MCERQRAMFFTSPLSAVPVPATGASRAAGGLAAGGLAAAGRALLLPRPQAAPALGAPQLRRPSSPPSERSAAAMSAGASVNALQRLVEQLKLEAAVERIKVSQAAAELQQYCMQNACKDALLVGVPAGSNPFREPRSCALL